MIPPTKFATPHDEALFWRGNFVHCHAGIEFAVTELLLRASYDPAYEQLGDVPFKWASKLARLERLFDMAGPLKSHRLAFDRMLRDIPRFARHRHLLVHGLMAFDPRRPGVLTFRMYDNPKESKGQLTYFLAEMTLEELFQIGYDLAPISAEITALVAQIATTVLTTPVPATPLEQVPY